MSFRVKVSSLYESRDEESSPSSQASTANVTHLTAPRADIDEFDAKTPLPTAWTLDANELKKSLQTISPASEKGIKRLQAIARGFFTRRALRDSHRSPTQSQSPYVPTPLKVIKAALQKIEVKPSDVLIDLGCGDGRICCIASENFRCSSIGVDLSASVVTKARESVRMLAERDAEAANLIEIIKMDFFDDRVAELLRERVSIVWLFLLPQTQAELAVTIAAEMRVGSLLLCYAFRLVMPKWVNVVWLPEKQITLDGSFFLPEQMSTLRCYRVTKQLQDSVRAALSHRTSCAF